MAGIGYHQQFRADTDWMDNASCGDTHHNWFPAVKTGPLSVEDREHLATLRGICAACPVQDHCLDHALEHYEAGVWAGTTEDQRKELRRARR